MVRICNNTYTPSTDDINTSKAYDDIFQEYPFELDHFQKYALQGIEEGKHVLITAHTGSGKTLPGEYAIKKFCGKGKKVIYTAPIKSLSNQKFYDFTEKFPEISFGILTGDLKFNPDADCLIMTTEILRNTLIQQEAMRKDSSLRDTTTLMFDMDLSTELACVVFDEVHYINDEHRGSVWEETIIKMPPQVQMLLLSATIDKTEQFAQWIETTKQRDVWIASTNRRVVPLTHYGYYITNQHLMKRMTQEEELTMKQLKNEFHVIKHSDGSWNHDTTKLFQKASHIIYKHRTRIAPIHVLQSVVQKLLHSNMLPAICFVFSRKKVEQYAQHIEKSLFITEQEQKYPRIIQRECEELIRQKLPNYKEYLSLPEYQQVVSLLQKGVAIHHSGILPILREMTELLFSKGYIKLLFATETFSVGINMPTKTVLFTSLEKWNGGGFRYLLPHEYTQMAGRAGRRGLDTVGHVIHLNNLFEMPTQQEYQSILCGSPQTLVSKFKIDIPMVLGQVLQAEKQASRDNDEVGDNTNSERVQQDCEIFVQKSMMYEEIKKELRVLDDMISDVDEKITSSMGKIKMCSTPEDEIQKYITLSLSKKSGKQKKKAERAKQMLQQEYPSIDKDVQMYKDLSTLKEERMDLVYQRQNTEHYIANHVDQVCELLVKEGCMKMGDTECNSYSLTHIGRAAHCMQETNGVVCARAIEKGLFHDVDVPILAALFASFTDVRVASNSQSAPSRRENGLIINATFDHLYEGYHTLMRRWQDTVLEHLQVTNEDDYVMTDTIIYDVHDWCLAETEAECKLVLQSLARRGIFVGEFVKAILKVNNIAQECMNACDVMENAALKVLSSKVADATLKFVATNQSLYV